MSNNPRLWLFNPENDIALVENRANFTPPMAAVKLRRSGEILPLWMSRPGDYILCHGINEEWLSRIEASFGIGARLWPHEHLAVTPTPWGWSEAARRTFENEDVAAEYLPDHKTLELYRQLSHRRTAAKISETVGNHLDIYPAARELTNLDGIDAIIRQNGHAVVKAPWSSSGRGVFFVDRNNFNHFSQSLSGLLRRQGSLMVEKTVDKKAEFALLFDCRNKECYFKGYSVFQTDANGAYKGNTVAGADYLESIICQAVPKACLDEMVVALQAAIAGVIAQDYTGPAGVDIIADTDGRMHISEINLRYTMGFVALGLQRFCSNPAAFTITPGDGMADTAIIRDGRLASGTLSLTPPGGDFAFQLSVLSC